jgi:hypothetical protein
VCQGYTQKLEGQSFRSNTISKKAYSDILAIKRHNNLQNRDVWRESPYSVVSRWTLFYFSKVSCLLISPFVTDLCTWRRDTKERSDPQLHYLRLNLITTNKTRLHLQSRHHHASSVLKRPSHQAVVACSSSRNTASTNSITHRQHASQPTVTAMVRRNSGT